MATTTPGIGEIKSKEHVHAEEQRERFRAIFEGWRAIAEVLLTAAIGYNMRGMHEIPPIELLDAINNPREGADMVGTMRDALLGQAWRARGHVGTGTCDYPLCSADRRGTRRPLIEIKLYVPRPSNREGSLGFGQDGGRLDFMAALRVCGNASDGEASECYAWGSWIRARAREGRIKVA